MVDVAEPSVWAPPEVKALRTVTVGAWIAEAEMLSRLTIDSRASLYMDLRMLPAIDPRRTVSPRDWLYARDGRLKSPTPRLFVNRRFRCSSARSCCVDVRACSTRADTFATSLGRRTEPLTGPARVAATMV